MKSDQSCDLLGAYSTCVLAPWQNPRREIAVYTILCTLMRDLATETTRPRDEQELQALPRPSWHVAPQVRVVDLQAPQIVELRQALREESSHVPVVNHAQPLQRLEAPAVVTHLVEHVVVHREIAQLRHLAKLAERKRPRDVVVRDIEVHQLREGLPIRVRQRTLDFVVAQQDVSQLGQISEGLWDSPLQALAIQEDLVHAIKLGLLGARDACHTLPLSETLRVVRVCGITNAHVHGQIAPAGRVAPVLPLHRLPERVQSLDVRRAR